MINQRGVIICRSPSGYGKSTFVKSLTNENVIVCSADRYFEDSKGNYKFDVSMLGEAHINCFRKYIKHCQYYSLYADDEPCCIVVDNTNINLEDIAPYIAIAEAYCFDIKIVQMSQISAEEAFSRNVHNVPKKTIESMVARMKQPPTKALPEICGTTMNDKKLKIGDFIWVGCDNSFARITAIENRKGTSQLIWYKTIFNHHFEKIGYIKDEACDINWCKKVDKELLAKILFEYSEKLSIIAKHINE